MRCKQGYVLLVVMAVSVLVITVLSTLAKLSLRRSLEAADAQRGLQMRWGARTIEQSLLKQAPKVFDQQQTVANELTPGTPPPTSIRAAVTLNGVTFDLLLADEDAKLNLNALFHHAGGGKTEQAIQTVIGMTQPGIIRLMPATAPQMLQRETSNLTAEQDESEAPPEVPAAFRSWGEVFDLAFLESRFESDVVLPNLTTDITCWGNGSLNFQRASDEAILAVAGAVIQDGGARRLLQRYRQDPHVGLEILLQTEVTNRQDRETLARLLVEASSNYSLWIDASSRGSRSLRTFTVTRRDDEGVTRQSRFAL